ncbi:Integron integrase IntI2 [uncultured Gammaproteobacteria bacterium]|jgi:integron integrase|uniref:integron integrase n=1 Tax=Bathymodiolus heckerae thiotrophic gill symbiont TaxID=1052212 RepID=UPI0010B37C81|nr:integron integrase [Bathymodiolus heckerae thiotrophic gill symbiont]CAC9565285.1 Integron integrase IntI2 [uncultured Gammaproteobacteria bacterium]CAC9606291.1 Integron integrase IntI2 [uncultured Gammaproteobacteria bacterium]CAC9962551.1 Integron integrase IntI2 [uncultured Gammaproteobacteria bacterium]SHN90137.1 Integron integrase IntI2 [Bathymodiolus heckerae thiotrophic gill symbiont]
MSIVPKNKTLLEEMRALLRRQGYAYGTENTYCDWVRRFVKFSNVQSRIEMLENAEQKVERFLTHLAIKQKVAPSTQNQALNALVFLYTKVLKQPLEGVNAARSRKEPRIPVVMSKKEVAKVLALIDGTVGLIVRLLYAGGLRISEAVRLRVQDVDFEFKQIIVRDGKGKKDRVTPLANNLMLPLQAHLEKIKIIHNKDLKEGFGSVYLPYALAKKYPNANKDFSWQYVFPSRNIAIDPRAQIKRRHHVDQSVINKAIKRAVKQAEINKKISAHTFRHSFATHLLQTGTDIRTIQALLGHADLQTTMIYTHVLRQGGQGVVSPLDRL